jgi:23S rRNA pseudouridine1911/1915/1917 synthase
LLNGKISKLSKKIKQGDCLEIYYSDPPPTDLTPENIDLDIIYEDEDVCVINKPQGMVVHPAGGNVTHTLVNALLAHCRDLKKCFTAGEQRPGIVHRLDKETSGVIITAKNVSAHEFLSKQFKERKVKKVYLALVQGRPDSEKGSLETWIFRDPGHRKRFASAAINTHPPFKARKALTNFKVIKTWEEVSLLSLMPHTGRTHQLRVHMKYLGCPIIGDDLYGTKKSRSSAGELMLHAYKLAIKIPASHRIGQFKAPLPPRFKSFIRELNK